VRATQIDDLESVHAMRFIVPTAATAFFAALALTWVVGKAARAWGVLDHPDGVRKLQRSPIPLLGGVAVFGAWILGMMIGGLYAAQSMPTTDVATQSILAAGGFGPSLLLAAGVVLFMGIVDDVVNLRPRWKLLGQIVAASILAAGGLMVRRLWLFGHTADLGWLGFLFSVVWLVGSMNSINMLDGLDGLASTLGLVLGLTLTWMACLSGDASLGTVSLALAGALAGFLLFNFPPASIYLGDSGSMLIGLLIGAVAIKGSFKGPATAALMAPVAVLALPIVDGLEAVIRRRLKGRAISSADRGHIHHCLQRFGWSTRQILLGIGALCAATGSAVLLSLYLRNEPIALAATLAVALGCGAAKVLGNREYLELFARPGARSLKTPEDQRRTAA
jgi:UDP-GlcNAc:undecaprenyl-phosphate/decaprenyl-phosphate GlcNAc-1-phosphate transferase